MLTTQQKNRWTTKRCLISASKASKACAERYGAGGPGLPHTFAGTRLVGQTRIHQRPATVAKQLLASTEFCRAACSDVPVSPKLLLFSHFLVDILSCINHSDKGQSFLTLTGGSSQWWGDSLWLLIKGHIEGLPIVSDALPLM